MMALGFTARVREVMVRPHISALPHMRLPDAYEVMQAHRVRHLPVVDDSGCLLGLLTEQAVLRAMYADPGRPDGPLLFADATVGALMDRAPPVVRPDDALPDVIERMIAGRLTCLPVVDAAGRLAGLLTRTDVLRAVSAPWLPFSSLEVSP